MMRPEHALGRELAAAVRGLPRGRRRRAAGLGAEIARELDDLERHWPGDLPLGVIHADLFPDNVFFQGSELSGIIDFYFACTDITAYDLAVCLNAWCFEADGAFNITKARQMLAAYRIERPFTGRRARGPAAARARRRAAVPPDPAVRLAEPGRGRAGQAQGPARVLRQAALPPRPVRARRLRSGLILATRSAAGSETVEIHTDGACSGNPGPGGWGAVLRWRGQCRELSGFAPATTNNRMELEAAIAALETPEAADDGRAVHRQQLSAPRDHRPGCRRGRRAAGRPPTRSRSRTRTCGSGSSRPSAATASSGAGSRATAATPTTSAPTSSPGRRSAPAALAPRANLPPKAAAAGRSPLRSERAREPAQLFSMFQSTRRTVSSTPERFLR